MNLRSGRKRRLHDEDDDIDEGDDGDYNKDRDRGCACDDDERPPQRQKRRSQLTCTSVDRLRHIEAGKRLRQDLHDTNRDPHGLINFRTCKKRTHDEMDWEAGPSMAMVVPGVADTGASLPVPIAEAPLNKKRNCVFSESDADDGGSGKEGTPASAVITPSSRRRWTINVVKCEQSLNTVDYVVT